MSTELVQLTENERADLAMLEETIEQGLLTFIDVGHALLQIREMQLYRETYSTFEDYCRDRWDIDRKYAYRLMNAAEVTVILSPMSPIGDIDRTLPANEAQARPLTKLKDPEMQRAAWIQAVKTAPDGRVTAAHVESVVREFVPPAAQKAEPTPLPAAEQTIDGVAETVDITPPVEDIGTRVPLETTWTGGVSFIQQQVKTGEMPNQLLLQKRGDRVMVDSFYAAQITPLDLVGAIVRMFGVDTIIGLAREAAAAIAAETVHVTPSLEEDAEPELAATLGSSEGVSVNGDDELETDDAADAGDDEAPDGDDEDQVRIAIPDVFPSPEAAHAWGVQMGAYNNVRQARSAYDGLKFKQQPKSARDMARLWINHCAQWVPELQEVLS